MTDDPSPPPSPSGELSPERAAVEAGAGVYRVELPTFEGPLDLLLHLIEEHELDIRDIPIAFIAHKYVEYITLMQEVNIDVASEYLVMAATLAHIKSKTLLPTPPAEAEEDEEDELDPRAELIRRLLEYQKYKHAAERLAAHDVLGRDVFPRGMPAPQVDGPAPIAGLSLFKLLDAFQTVLSRAKATIDHQIDFERFSITDRINELSDLLKVRSRLSFEDLFDGQRARAELIVTFLALLEMTRLRMIRLYQDGPLEMIFVELAVREDGSPEGPMHDPIGAMDAGSPLASDQMAGGEPAAEQAPGVESGLGAGFPEEDPERGESDEDHEPAESDEDDSLVDDDDESFYPDTE
jgi:segregation and condensation protein A